MLREGRRPDLGNDWGAEEKSRWGTLGTPDDEQPLATEPGAYQHFYAAVGAALRGEGELPVDPRDSIEGLRIIAAAQRSSRENSVVAL